jgi:tetratricopeptide (TPR) repeat protein
MRNANLRLAAIVALVAALGVVAYATKEPERSGFTLLVEPDSAVTVARATGPRGDAYRGMPRSEEPALAVGNPQSAVLHPTAQAATAPQNVSYTELPGELRELLELAVVETIRGNYTNAALVALDAIELSDKYPSKREYLHQLAGWNYEQAGSFDFAMEQYRLALAINPTQRNAYSGLRRLDAKFGEDHPPLPTVTSVKPPKD